MPSLLRNRLLCSFLLVGSAVLIPCSWADEDMAAQIFQTKCAACHGPHGEGVPDGYEKPLRGEHSLSELTQLIVETMPEEDPEQCIGEEAQRIAAYIYDEFYSRRSELPRRELTRLTVDQYLNSVADLIGQFATTGDARSSRRPGRSSEPTVPGLRGEYYQSRGMSKADRLGHYSSDSRFEFDFGTGSPAPTISADQFSIIWQGGLIANDTGHYEFRVSTQNGARMYLNLDPKESRRKLRDDSSTAGQQALIDAWVGSGELRERKARVFLLSGRVYPIRLEFFKYLEETASVKLEWKPPHGTWAVLDYNDTTTVRPARVYVCETPFPADDRSLGYERGISISPEWQTATTNAAVRAAAEVVQRLPLLADLGEQTSERAQRVKDFLLRFGSVAFRRPLTSAEARELEELVDSDPANVEAGVRRAVVLVLMSPHFLYTDLTPVDAQPSPYAVASRLSFGLWDSIPSAELLDAAREGQLETTEQIEKQARRMLANPRTKAKMRSFFRNWLELEERDLAKDKQLFPDFDEAVIADLRRSLELFIERIVWSSESDYRQLLLSNDLVLNDRLRQLYESERLQGETVWKGKDRNRRVRVASDFQPVSFPADQRSGVLTHPYLLSAYAYHNDTSPIHRGVFLTRNIVGRVLNPPPIAVAFKNDEFAPELTMREKITQLTRDTACMSCHSVINPLGFTLENFDAVGRWRTIDNNKPVDTKSEYTTVDGETLEIASARDVAEFAVAHRTAQRAFVMQVFRHIVKQDPAAYAPDLIDNLTQEFADDNFNIQNLWAKIAATTASHNGRMNSSPTNEETP